MKVCLRYWLVISANPACPNSEEAMRKAGTAHTKSSSDMENHVYIKAKTRVSTQHCGVGGQTPDFAPCNTWSGSNCSGFRMNTYLWWRG